MPKFNILELYAGTGRSLEPLLNWKRAGKTLLVDSNPYAKTVYVHNFPRSNYLTSDLTTASPKELETSLGGKVDILLGCPPCQGYSDCGTRTWNDSRNKHMDRFLFYIERFRPRAVGIENVPLAYRSVRFRRLIQWFDEHQFLWSASIVNAALHGSCQTRQRLILVALSREVGIQPSFPSASHGGTRKYFSYREQKMARIDSDPRSMLGVAPGSMRVLRSGSGIANADSLKLGAKSIPTVGEQLEGLPKIGSASAKESNHFEWSHTQRISRRMDNVTEGGRWHGGDDHYSQTYGRLHRRGLARTITNYFPNAGSGRFWHPTENRAISLREAARIQGFPDSFRFLENHGENCCLVGNALDAAFARLTADMLKKYLE